MSHPTTAPQDVLDALGITTPPLGSGGEAAVYALGDDRVARILHAGGSERDVIERFGLVDRLDRMALSFELPQLLDLSVVGTRTVAIERRLPGRPIHDALGRLDRDTRDSLVIAHLEAIAELGGALITHPDADGVGDVIGPFVRHADGTRNWLEVRAADSLGRAPADFGGVDPAGLADALPHDGPVGFCHFDGFAGNVLCEGSRITAIIDIGVTSAVVDRRLDLLATAVYSRADFLLEVIDADDERAASQWLHDRNLESFVLPMQRWLAAYWSWATDDERLHAWCRHILLEDA